MRVVMRGIGAAIALAALALPGSAAAEVTSYHPADNARMFGSGAGGWQGSESTEGTCLQQLTCPTVTTTWQASGGTRGGSDGFLRTTIDNSIAGAESVTRGIWTSPPFTYHGVGGDEPGEVTFEVARRSDLTALNESTGSTATYTVELINAASGVGRTIVDDAPLGTIQGWTRTRRMNVNSSSLTIGRAYRMRITSTFNTTAKVFRESFVDYDDVLLRAVSDTNGSGGGGGGNGGGGNGAGGGGNGAGGGNGGAVLHGKRLFLRLQCLGVAKHGRCKVRAVAYSKPGKKAARMTFPIERRVNAKKGKKVTLRVRPRFVRKLSNAERCWSVRRSRPAASARRSSSATS